MVSAIVLPTDVTPSVMDPGELWLDGFAYPCVPDARYTALGMWPQKFVMGDPGRDDDLYTSAYTIFDLTGGAQMDKVDPSSAQRYWRGVIDSRYPGAITLPPMVDEYTFSAAGAFWPVGDLGTEAWGVFGASLRKFQPGATPGTGSYPTDAGSITSPPVNIGFKFRSRLYIPQGSAGYKDWDGTTLRAGASNITAVAFAKLASDYGMWAFESDGQLSFKLSDGNANADWTSPTELKIFDETPRRLVAFRNTAGDPALVAITDRGWWLVDPLTPRVWPAGEYPPHANFGHGGAVWNSREDLWIPVGTDMVRWTGDAVLRGAGLNRNHGLPKELRGYITDLAFEQSGLWALVRGNPDVTAEETFLPSTPHFRSEEGTFSAAGARSSLFVRTEPGWHQMWESPDASSTPTRVVVSTANGSYRLIWGHGSMAHHMDLEPEFYNPEQGRQAGTKRFAATGYFETGRIFGGSEGLDKLHSHLMNKMLHATADERVVWTYTTDLIPSPQSLGVVDQARRALRFDVVDDFSRGLIGEWIRLRADFFRADATAADQYKTPTLDTANLKFLKLPVPTKAYTVTILIPPEGYNDRSPQEMTNHLDELTGTYPFVQVVIGRRIPGTATADPLRCRISQVVGVQRLEPDGSGTRDVSFIVVPDGREQEG